MCRLLLKSKIFRLFKDPVNEVHQVNEVHRVTEVHKFNEADQVNEDHQVNEINEGKQTNLHEKSQDKGPNKEHKHKLFRNKKSENI